MPNTTRVGESQADLLADTATLVHEVGTWLSEKEASGKLRLAEASLAMERAQRLAAES